MRLFTSKTRGSSSCPAGFQRTPRSRDGEEARWHLPGPLWLLVPEGCYHIDANWKSHLFSIGLSMDTHTNRCTISLTQNFASPKASADMPGERVYITWQNKITASVWNFYYWKSLETSPPPQLFLLSLFSLLQSLTFPHLFLSHWIFPGALNSLLL